MSNVLDYVNTKKYIVTVYDHNDLDAVYADLETAGRFPPNTEILRDVLCVDRRPFSRNTVYLLCDWEAAELKKDPRIKSVTVHPELLGIQAGLNNITQTSSAWDKSYSDGSTMKNWALLRCTEGTQRAGWGGDGTAAQTATIQLSQTGRNVDVVICDDNGLVVGHPEYAQNADGTGGSRFIQYNWFQHDPVVKGIAAGNYVYSEADHSTHVAGTVAGNTQGWARNANIYNIFYFAGDYPNFNFPYVMDYIRAFHTAKAINPATGRKNPTIVNNSWGMSIFPGEWSFNDITAVTYRGTRFTPIGTTTFLGTSGVCTTSTLLANLPNLELGGNRITTTGTVAVVQGTVTSKPASWTQTSSSSAVIQDTIQPAAEYVVTVNTTANNVTINVRNQVAAGSQSGVTTLTVRIQILNAVGATVYDVTNGPFSSVEGGSVSAIVDNTVTLSTAGNYTINYLTSLFQPQVNPTVSFDMLADINITPGTTAATVTSIGSSLLGAASLTASTTPTVGGNDDGYWNLALPFNITYLGVTYNQIFVGTNCYLTFGNGSTVWNNVSVTNPALPKIMWCAKDNSVQRIYYGVEGFSPNRTYRVRQEGTATVSGTVGNPTMISEWTFYESVPDRIDLQTGINNAKNTSGTFTSNQLNAWGFISNQRIPQRVSALDDDLEDAYNEGIIMTGAAGNGRWKHEAPGGPDWNNTFEMGIRYPNSVAQPYYYMRGTSPTANDNTTVGTHNLPAICVGAVDNIQIDQKVTFSDCGPGVDIFAPGSYIISSLPYGVADPRNASFFIGKFSGTSMASPQVCGVLACALQTYPNMNQNQAKAYITGIAKTAQLTGSNGGPTDGQDLQGAPNLYLFYRIERKISGNTFPKINNRSKPTAGAMFPRPKIRRTA